MSDTAANSPYDFAFCHLSCVPLREEASDPSQMVSQVIFGEGVEILERPADNWYKVRCHHDGYEGFLDPKQLTALSPDQWKKWKKAKKCRMPSHSAWLMGPLGKVMVGMAAWIPEHEGDKFQIGDTEFRWLEGSIQSSKPELLDLANQYLNTPYLWGGRSPFGVDCSGFTQTVFSCVGKELPRDAYQQAEEGKKVDFEDQQPGDLAFFINDKGRIHHVGLVLDSGRIIHASGQVRIDELKEDGIYRPDLGRSHKMAFLKRL